MFKTIAVVVAVVLGVPVVTALTVAATKPDRFHVERSSRIQAPPEQIFPFLNDYRRWRTWSPYEKLDPEMKRTYSGAETGQGSVYEWDGDGNAGKGRIEIIESTPPTGLTMTLDMVKPMACRNIVTYTLEPQGDSTKVTWAMDGAASYASKIVQVFISMDSMVGSQFEEGLANLKTAAEKDKRADRTSHAE